MQFVSHIGAHSVPAPVAPGSGNNTAAPGFMLPAVAPSAMARGATATSATPLASQNVSFLLQTQEVKHGGGHGGSGHHGMKMQDALEAEEMAESGEMDGMTPRRKLARSGTAAQAKETDETGEDAETEDGQDEGDSRAAS